MSGSRRHGGWRESSQLRWTRHRPRDCGRGRCPRRGIRESSCSRPRAVALDCQAPPGECAVQARGDDHGATRVDPRSAVAGAQVGTAGGRSAMADPGSVILTIARWPVHGGRVTRRRPRLDGPKRPRLQRPAGVHPAVPQGVRPGDPRPPRAGRVAVSGGSSRRRVPAARAQSAPRRRSRHRLLPRRAGLPDGSPVTLLDPNANVLGHASRRLRNLDIKTVEADVLKPLPVEGPFDSAALNGVLHCLPGPLSRKAAAVANVAAVLAPEGVLFGSSILGDSGRHTWLGRRILEANNRRGTFDNLGDTEEGLRAILEASFERVELDTVGSMGIFAATHPRRSPLGSSTP